MRIPWWRGCDGKHHRWSHWHVHNKYDEQRTVHSRSCRCGSIQRYKPSTGEVTIWSPDGIESGLLDRGLVRRTYEEL